MLDQMQYVKQIEYSEIMKFKDERNMNSDKVTGHWAIIDKLSGC